MTGRILVVDDNTQLLGAIATLLSRCGYDVFPASGPVQALEIARSHPPIDVVLSDLTMPQMRGTDLVRHFEQLSPETAFVIMTGGVVDSAEIPSDVPLIRKPLTRLDLIAVIENAIAHSAALRAELRQSSR
jgi:CheY-like chemotaxis protein